MLYYVSVILMWHACKLHILLEGIFTFYKLIFITGDNLSRTFLQSGFISGKATGKLSFVISQDRPVGTILVVAINDFWLLSTYIWRNFDTYLLVNYIGFL